MEKNICLLKGDLYHDVILAYAVMFQLLPEVVDFYNDVVDFDCDVSTSTMTF